MARKKDRARAILLRRQRMSYSQIKNQLNVSKSSLSLWLRDYPLTRERINELRGSNEKRIERYRETRRKQREKRLEETYQRAVTHLLPLTNKEFQVAGYLLYAGEGAKTQRGVVSLSNNDPNIINFFIGWLEKSCEISKEKIFVRLQLYRDMDPEKETIYWQQKLPLTEAQYKKPYFKNSLSKDITHKGGFGHGTCNIFTYNTPLFEKITMSIRVLTDHTSRA